LLSGELKSRYKLHSEYYARDQKHPADEVERVDMFMEPIDKVNGDDPIVLEVKSIPIYWLNPSTFGKRNLHSLNTKKEVSIKLSDPNLTYDYFQKLELNQNMGWIKEKKTKLVGDYVEEGRMQLINYLKSIETKIKVRPRGYLVWSVGMVAIHVEEV